MIFNNLQRAIQLSYSETNDFSNGFITGWGSISFPNRTLPNTLQKLDVAVIANEMCQQDYGDIIHPTHLCGYSGIEKGICLVNIIKVFIYTIHIYVLNFIIK
jgi:hypothetical protein